MNIFSDRALAKRFRDGNVSSVWRLFYMTSFVFAQSVLLTTFFSNFSDNTIDLWSNLTDGLMIVTAIFGTIALWYVNRRGDDREFIERYICLSFPIFFHMFAISMALFVALSLLASLFGYDEHPSTTPIHSFAIVVVIYAWYYWRLFLSFRTASGAFAKQAKEAADDDPDGGADDYPDDEPDENTGRTLYGRLSMLNK